LDVATRTATTGDSDGVISSTDVRELQDGEWDIRRIEVGDGRAVVLLRDTDAGEAAPTDPWSWSWMSTRVNSSTGSTHPMA
jgi:hypothetical protein